MSAKIKQLISLLLDWYEAQARDLPWRRTRDAYAVWVSEIMLQQTQVKTVIPYWERWRRELPTIEAAAKASPDKVHKLWEGLGYYTRVRNLQKAAQMIVAQHDGKFPERFEEVLALPGIGRYTAGAICSIAFNQPTPILDGNVVRVLTRIFGIGENPKAKETNGRLWELAERLVAAAAGMGAGTKSTPRSRTRLGAASARQAETLNGCSQLNQSLMELGALVCTPRLAQCGICPVKELCVAFRENRVDALPNLGPRTRATARHFHAYVVQREGKFLVRQRPAGVVNAHLWEFPNVEIDGRGADAKALLEAELGWAPGGMEPLITLRHSITRYRITVEAFWVEVGGGGATTRGGVWRTAAQLRRLAFTSAHRRILKAASAAGKAG